MEGWQGLVAPDVFERLQRLAAGEDVARRLDLGRLQPGDVGVVEATVAQGGSPRTFLRRDGREGTMGRVTLRDTSGETELVLWGDQTALLAGPLGVGRHVRLQGAVVRPGYRGGPPELALAGEVAELEAASSTRTLEGTLALDPAEPVATPGGTRFRAEGALLDGGGEPLRVLLWDEALRQARHAGPQVRLTAMAAHPVLDGLWLSTPGTTVRRIAPASMK